MHHRRDPAPTETWGPAKFRRWLQVVRSNNLQHHLSEFPSVMATLRAHRILPDGKRVHQLSDTSSRTLYLLHRLHLLALRPLRRVHPPIASPVQQSPSVPRYNNPTYISISSTRTNVNTMSPYRQYIHILKERLISGSLKTRRPSSQRF